MKTQPILHIPNVERLAREGMKFRNAYGSTQCSPTHVRLNVTVQSVQRFHLVVSEP